MRDADKDAQADELRAQQTEIEENRDREGGEEEQVEEAPQEMNRFFRLAEAMRMAASAKSDAEMPKLGDDFTREERHALEDIFEAFSAHDAEVWLDAEQRDELLNRGLAVLQPVLALGMMPELHAEELYEDLSDRVGALREHLEKLADAQEEIQRKEDEEGVESDEDDDEDDDDDDKAAAAKAEEPLDEAARLAAKHKATAEHLGITDPLPVEPKTRVAPSGGGPGGGPGGKN